MSRHVVQWNRHVAHCSGCFRAPADLAFQSLCPLVAAMVQVGPLGQKSFMAMARRDRDSTRAEGVSELLTGDAHHQRTAGTQAPVVDWRPRLWIAGMGAQEAVICEY